MPTYDAVKISLMCMCMCITIWVVLTTAVGIHAVSYGTFVRDGCESTVVVNCKMHVTVVEHKPYLNL
jgi:hypothetical protein